MPSDCAEASRSLVPSVADRWQQVVIVAGGVALLAGLALEDTWKSLHHPERIAGLLVIAATALGAAWGMRRWRRWPIASGLAAFAIACLAVFAGPLPVLATALLAAAAIGVGTLVSSGGLSLAIGLGVIAGVVGWLLPLPVHWQWSYLLAMAGITAVRRSAIRATLQAFGQEWSRQVADAPSASTLGALALFVATLGCWLPTMQYDDLAYHLGLPSQLQATGRYALDPAHQVWALAPWAGDVLHGIAQVVAERESRGALNALWLFVGALGVHRLAGLMGAAAWARWAAAGLFATLPLSVSLAAGMQTELPGAAITVTLAWLIVQGAGSRTRSAMAGGILFGLLCALKLMHAAAALPLLLWAAWRHRDALGWRSLAVAGTSAAVVGGASYVYALVVAGNPILPLENATFRSPYFPVRDFIDERWGHGLAFDLPWQLTFETARFYEGFDGALGFLLVGAAGAWLVALVRSRSRGLAIAASAGLLLTLIPLQYARYLYPSIVLLIAPMAAAIDAAMPRSRAAALVAGLCLLQLAFFGSGYWMIRAGAIKDTVVVAGDDSRLFAQFVPGRQLIARVRASSPPAGAVLVLGTGPGVFAELGRRSRTISSYSPWAELAAARANSARDGGAWVALIRREGITDIILRQAALSSVQRDALDRLHARRIDVEDDVEWWRIPDAAP